MRKKQHKYKYTGIYPVADHMLKNYYNTIGQHSNEMSANNKTKDIISDHKTGGLQNEISTIE